MSYDKKRRGQLYLMTCLVLYIYIYSCQANSNPFYFGFLNNFAFHILLKASTWTPLCLKSNPLTFPIISISPQLLEFHMYFQPLLSTHFLSQRWKSWYKRVRVLDHPFARNINHIKIWQVWRHTSSEIGACNLGNRFQMLTLHTRPLGIQNHPPSSTHHGFLAVSKGTIFE